MTNPNPYGTPGRARAQLHELRSRWGTIRIVDGTEAEPVLIERTSPMGNCEVWRREPGQGAGTRAWFERIKPEGT